MAITGKPVYLGSGDGGLKFTYSGLFTMREDGVVELRSSGVFVPERDMNVDIFGVGGGGKGAAPRNAYEIRGYGGGGGGYTKTVKGVILIAGVEYPVTIGAGSNEYTKDGNATSFGSILTAAGGKTASSSNVNVGMTGANGGSGGGGGTAIRQMLGMVGAKGGYNGGNGNSNTIPSGQKGYAGPGGSGQGTTTREFGDVTGRLYAGGGGGGMCAVDYATATASEGGDGGGGTGALISSTSTTNATLISTASTAGTNNTGGGGGGGAISGESVVMPSGDGGSGIVCIRLHKAT